MKSHAFFVREVHLSKHRKSIFSVLRRSARDKATVEQLLGEIDHAVSLYLGASEAAKLAVETPVEIRSQIEKITKAFEVLAHNFSLSQQGTARALLVGEAASRGVINEFAMLEMECFCRGLIHSDSMFELGLPSAV